jgi:23S rRNA (cytosine1962-C5)-methyltransferase
LSGLKDKPLRSICEDALVFVRREIKRGNRYDGILLDPPAFGNGPTGEKWLIEEDLPELIELLREVLTDKPLFFLVNGYASGYSSTGYMNLIKPTLEKFGGTFESGELGIQESGDKPRVLPCGIYARWSVER